MTESSPRATTWSHRVRCGSRQPRRAGTGYSDTLIGTATSLGIGQSIYAAITIPRFWCAPRHFWNSFVTGRGGSRRLRDLPSRHLVYGKPCCAARTGALGGDAERKWGKNHRRSTYKTGRWPRGATRSPRMKLALPAWNKKLPGDSGLIRGRVSTYCSVHRSSNCESRDFGLPVASGLSADWCEVAVPI